MTRAEWEKMNHENKVNRFNRTVMIPAIIVAFLALVGGVMYDTFRSVDPGKSGAIILSR